MWWGLRCTERKRKLLEGEEMAQENHGCGSGRIGGSQGVNCDGREGGHIASARAMEVSHQECHSDKYVQEMVRKLMHNEGRWGYVYRGCFV